ncbi:hypothetical protein [Enterococcus sp. AZ103]|uniref:hypothetical protein n=1 Tax=Enterococcus sp. AZ103 TaxID=2774628 RepID=UPI003F26AF86
MGYINEAQETLDWAQRNNQIFLIMFIVVFTVLLLVLYVAFKLLVTERKESQKERNSYLETIQKQQNLVSEQQALLEDEKRIFENMSKDITEINFKLDRVVIKKE